MQENTMSIDQTNGVALANESNGSAFDDGDS